MSAPARPYLSNGQVLESPPLAARLRNAADGTYNFFGLYLTSLFSLDAYAAAEASQFNVRGPNRSGSSTSRGSGGGGGGGFGGGGPSNGGGGGGGKRLGRVDDIRGPECKSCQ